MIREDRKRIADLATYYNKETRDVEFNISFAKEMILKFPFSYFNILRGKRFANFWQCVIDNTHILDEYYSEKDITRLFYFMNRIDKVVCCSTCGKPILHKMIPTVYKWPSNIHCSNQCAQKDPLILEKVKSTKEAHGTTTRALLERTKKRNLEKFGVEWYFQSDEFCKKKEDTWHKNGYDHPMHSQDIKDAMAKRYFDKHGVDCSFKDAEVQRKAKQKYKYNGLWFDSMPEIAFYIWLRENNKKFEYKPKVMFYYNESNGKQHFYMPDFKVDEQYIEIKGDQFFDANGKMINPFDVCQNDNYEAKHQCMLKNNVKILRTAEYMQYVNYVEEKYGKGFLKQFKKDISNG